jgi:hypothetical protein
VSLAIQWSAIVPGHSRHLLVGDPDGAHLYVADGWGVAYTNLSLRILNMADGAEQAKVRTRHQQARAIAFADADALVATDSRLFQLSRKHLVEKHAWDSRVPRYADTIVHENGKLLMANWLRPTAAVFDLDNGRSSRLPLEPGVRALHRGRELLVYALSSGVLRSLDLTTRSQRVLIQGEPGRGVTIIADRWLAVLKADWKTDSGGVQLPAHASREIALYDLEAGTVHAFPLSRDTVAVEGAANSSLLWLLQLGSGSSELPSAIEQVELPSFRSVQTVVAPVGSDLAQVMPSKSVVVFVVPNYAENRATLSLARMS